MAIKVGAIPGGCYGSFYAEGVWGIYNPKAPGTIWGFLGEGLGFGG